MNESILSDLASAKEKMGELQRAINNVQDTLDGAITEINELRSELEGKNYELEMIRMELEVLKSA